MEDSNNTPINYDFSNKKILIVEDIESNFKLLIALLKPTKAQVILAENGLKAVEFCKTIDDIDLVLMDIMLPDINGIEATRKIKEFKKELPIIAQTAFAMGGDREKCLEAGCDEYISKPISRSSLLSLIADKLNK
jgi:two-component system, cell cycle response regulator DivK